MRFKSYTVTALAARLFDRVVVVCVSAPGRNRDVSQEGRPIENTNLPKRVRHPELNLSLGRNGPTRGIDAASSRGSSCPASAAKSKKLPGTHVAVRALNPSALLLALPTVPARADTLRLPDATPL
jgi:hypothetical protein